MTWDLGADGPSQQILTTLGPNADLSALGMYNVAADKYGASPSASASANLAAFQAALNDLNTAGSGKLVIPNLGAAYPLSGTLNPGAAPGAIVGVGKPELSKQDSTDLFDFNGTNNPSGFDIRDLKIKFANAPGLAISVKNSASVRALRVYFSQCAAMNVFTGSLQCGIEQSTIDANNAAGITLVTLNGAQAFLRSSVLRQTPIASGGGRNNVGVTVGGATAIFLDGNHLSDFDTGMTVTDGMFELFATDNKIDAYTIALLIRPSASNKTIQVLRFSKLLCKLTNASSVVGHGIFADSNGGPASNVDDLDFDACMSNGFGTYGFEFGVCQNAKLRGGGARGNGSGGVGITGAGGVKAYGFDALGAAPGGSAVQPYGFVMPNGAGGNLFADGCDLTGNVTAPTSIGTGNTSRLVNCPGFN